jgi:hypothetical protein
MTLTIGRASGLRPTRSSPSLSNTIDIDGTIIAASTTELRTRRQQLVGLVDNPDEEVVPILWATDPSYDGFYRIRDVVVRQVGPTGSARASFRVSAERVGGYANPVFEVVASNVTRTNGHSATGAALLYVPDPAFYDIDGFSSVSAFGTRPTADGINVQVLATSDPNGRSYRFNVAPADYYRASCTVEVEVGGAWQLVVGTQIPRATRFRISNGIVRLTSANSGTGATFEAWNGSAWISQGITLVDSLSTLRALGRWAPGMSAVGDLPVTVVRNSPEAVVVRQSGYSDQVSYSLLRGARHVTVPWAGSSNVSGTTTVGIGMTTGIAGSDGGGYVTANTAVSNVGMMFATAAADTVDTTNTRVRNTTAALAGTLFVGCTVGGGVDTTLSTAGNVFLQMMSGVNWRQRVVRQ